MKIRMLIDDIPECGDFKTAYTKLMCINIQDEKIKAQVLALLSLFEILFKELDSRKDAGEIRELAAILSHVFAFIDSQGRLSTSRNSLNEIINLDIEFKNYFLDETDFVLLMERFSKSNQLDSIKQILTKLTQAFELKIVNNNIKTVDGLISFEDKKVYPEYSIPVNNLENYKAEQLKKSIAIQKDYSPDLAIQCYANEIFKSNHIYNDIINVFSALNTKFTSEFNLIHKLKLLELVFDKLQIEIEKNEEISHHSFFKRRNLKYSDQDLSKINELKSLYIECIESEENYDETLKKHIASTDARNLIDFQQTRYEIFVSKETNTSQKVRALIK